MSSSDNGRATREPCARTPEVGDMVAGVLSEADEAALLDHMASCELCLDEADRLWASQPGMAVTTLEAIEPPSLRRGEIRLINRLDRSDMGAQTLVLATTGLIKVILSLLEPFFGMFGAASARPASPTATSERRKR